MIYCESRGRLGNQLFQYSAAMSAAGPRERVVLVGFVELRAHFGQHLDSRTRWISLRWFARLSRLRREVFGLLLIGRIRLGDTPASFRRENGVLGLWEFAAGYCQDQRLVPEAIANQLIRALTQDGAIDNGQTASSEVFRCFVHIRRGDYVKLEEFSTPPISWFEQQMERLLSENPSAIFILCSDEPAWASKAFRQFPSVTVFRGDEKDTLKMMSGCDAGILSPSTFSWWGAKFAIDRGAVGPFIAPKYWLGWHNQEWYPKTISHHGFVHIPVVD